MVRLTIELRDLSSAKITALATQIMSQATEIAEQTKTEIDMQPATHHDPAIATPEEVDRGSLRQARLEIAPPAKWRRTRCADDGDARTDGYDLHPKRERDQSRAAGAQSMGRLHARRRRLA
jgi:hypothetical protein